MNQKQELARIINDYMEADVPDDVPGKHEPCSVDYAVADKILAAGYRKHRIIEGVEELDALPVGSIIIDIGPDGRESDAPVIACKSSDGYWEVGRGLKYGRPWWSSEEVIQASTKNVLICIWEPGA